jgi:hypothetical protein
MFFKTIVHRLTILPSAIARIDRMGQTKPTEGKGYLVVELRGGLNTAFQSIVTMRKVRSLHTTGLTELADIRHRNRRKEYLRPGGQTGPLAIYERQLSWHA